MVMLPHRRRAFQSSNVPPVGSVLFFCEASQEVYGDNAAVSQITDLSGNGYHATQADATKQPIFKTGIINGRSVYRFDGTNDGVPFSGAALGIFNNRSDWTMYAVAVTTTVALGTQTIFTCSTSAGSSLLRYTLSANGSTAGRQTATVRPSASGSFTRITGGVSTIAVGVPYLSTSIVKLSATTMELFFNNSATPDVASYASVTGPVEALNSAQMNIGQANTTSAFWSGDIALILLCGGAHDATTRDTVRAWISRRYAIAP